MMQPTQPRWQRALCAVLDGGLMAADAAHQAAHRRPVQTQRARRPAPARDWHTFASECTDAKHPPELIDWQGTTADDVMRIIIRPHATWGAGELDGFTSAACNKLGGTDATWRTVSAGRFNARQVLLEIPMRELPDVQEDGTGGLPYPLIHPGGPGALIGIDSTGQEVRVVFGATTGIPHLLIAGPSGFGKTACARHVIREHAIRHGWDTVEIDPKGEGDLDDIRPGSRALVDPKDIRGALRRIVEWMDRRAEQKRRGIISERGLLVTVDESADVMTGNRKSAFYEAGQIVEQLARRSRGTSIHLMLLVQQASAEALGGDTYVRNQLYGRISVGELDPESARMMFGSQGITPALIERMRSAGRGAALGARLRLNQRGVTRFQVFAPDPEDTRPEWVVVDDRDAMRQHLGITTSLDAEVMAGLEAAASAPDPTPDDEVEVAGVVAEQASAGLHEGVTEPLDAAVLIALTPHGGQWVRRSTLEQTVREPLTTLRRSLDRLAGMTPPRVETGNLTTGNRACLVRLALGPTPPLVPPPA